MPIAMATAPIQIARAIRWRNVIDRMLPLVPSARAEPLFDEPKHDPAHRPNYDDVRGPLRGTSVSLKLQVNASGRATGCTVARSSGNDRVDAQVCTAFIQRSRWLPARDRYGNPVAGEVTTRLAW
jgi:protein TonB